MELEKHAIPSPWTQGTGKTQDFSCYEGRKKIGRETHRLHKVVFCALGHRLRFVVKRECFAQFGIWNKISSMQKGISTVEIFIPRDMETSENETAPTGVCGMPHTPVAPVGTCRRFLFDLFDQQSWKYSPASTVHTLQGSGSSKKKNSQGIPPIYGIPHRIPSGKLT